MTYSNLDLAHSKEKTQFSSFFFFFMIRKPILTNKSRDMFATNRELMHVLVNMIDTQCYDVYLSESSVWKAKEKERIWSWLSLRGYQISAIF